MNGARAGALWVMREGLGPSAAIEAGGGALCDVAGARWERVRGLLVLVLGCASLAVVGVAAGACSSTPSPAASPSSIEEAFESSHPGGALPPGLKPADDTHLRSEELSRVSGLVRVLVPGWLPGDYVLAAPYVAVGDGGALPNPQVWKGGYRISFTDSDGLVILQAGSGRLPGAGEWEPLARRWRGERLWRREANGLVTIAARERAVPVAVAVAGLPESVALEILSALREAP